MTVFLLFGLPESGIDGAARALHASGAALATDAETMDGRFAVSSELEQVASEINAGFGIAEEPIGPVAFANTAMSVSRARIDSELRQHLPHAAAAVGRALSRRAPDPIVIVAAGMSAFPAFWLRAFQQAGCAARPVLVHRNPLAIAQLARVGRGRAVRQTIFQWHHLALALLDADQTTALLHSPDFEIGTLDPRLLAPPDHPAAERHPRDDADLAHAPAFSDQSRDLAALLDRWSDLEAGAKASAIASLRTRYDDAVTLTGSARIATFRTSAEPPAAALPVRSPTSVSRLRPPLIFHYHIFKNAGTSVDRMLKANFGERWTEREFTETPASRRHQSIHDFLQGEPGLQAFSSHTAPLPEPELADREIFPVLFVRHPLLRIRSAYQFEHRQDATTRGAILAKQTDLRGYVTTFLDDPKARQVRNFQAARFAGGTPGRPAQERQRVLATLDRLPFVGLVEAFDESVMRLGTLIRPLFPEFEPLALHENATAGATARSTEDQLARLRDELGADLYDRLVAENGLDLELYGAVRTRYPTAA